MPFEYLVCSPDDIHPDCAKGFTIDTRQGKLEFFIVNKENHFYAYKNSCPHTGVNLEWKADEFLNLDKNLIQCSTHGAQFIIENGYCIYGPCQGRHLTKVPVSVSPSEIRLTV